ncbi:MAG: SDR family oxidoreductase [Salinivirgaceae bacterium]|jgi:dTDP-4-dehydrorhamnose reductase|nr:SDR family oxidoreductase [Salinivirgaceae bacterium]
MKRILLTGSNGFVGQHVACLAGAMPNVSLKGCSAKPNIHNYCRFFEQIDFVCQRITPVLLQGYDAVIHTAALSHVDYCHANRKEAFLVNVEASRQLAEACKETGTHLVFVSSDFVMEGVDKLVHENEPANPVNYYGRTKEMAEMVIQNILPQATIVRPVLIFGNTLAGTRSNLVLWVKSSLGQGKAIRVTENNFRTATYVQDLAELLINMALNPRSGIYHASGSSYLSIYQMALCVARHFQLPEHLISPVHSSVVDVVPRPPCTHFSSEKAVEHYGFKSRSFEDALSQMD